VSATGAATAVETATIFVQLAAYREPELADTIASCLEQANHPERLRFGICLQYDDSIAGAGVDCLDPVSDRAELRVARYPHHLSIGGCWARFVAQGLYDGEDFTLQVDAHTRMSAGWDDVMVALVRELPGDKPLVTGFPALYRLDGGEVRPVGPVDGPVPVTKVVSWAADGWISHPTSEHVAHSPSLATARPARVLSGAFVFTVGAWNVEVRQDPEHLYTGEEFALTLRSFTSGYDLWSPPRRLLWHRTHPTANPKYIHDDPDGRKARRHDKACRRLRVLLAGDPDGVLDPFSLGTERTLEQYWEHSGLRWPERTISEAALAGEPPSPLRAGVR
jgi:hypothetical protein